MTSFASRLEVEAQIQFALIFMDVSKVVLCCLIYLFCVRVCLFDRFGVEKSKVFLWVILWIK